MSSKLSEADVCAKLIDPAVAKAGWDDHTQIRRQVFYTQGQVIVRGKMVTRGKRKFVDYLLYYRETPLALIEAKDNEHAIGDGMQQGLEYAAALNVPFVFSSNGSGFVFHDRTGASDEIETTLQLHAFPSPADLWARYRVYKGLSPDAESVVLQPYHDDGSGKTPHYYQRNAINAAVEAIAKGQNRILLVMATGTGKTYTAFQIIWRLWKSGRKKRILFLADRNVLIDQTMVNDFKPFGPAMAKLSTASNTIERSDGSIETLTTAIDTQRRIEKSYEIYLGLYQAITGPEDAKKLYRSFSPDFFDLIVIDECHRGSAAEDSAWREILEYFNSATQIGLTATPKETAYVSNMDYFGAPVYTYSLKQGINDGFLAPYKVIKVHLSVDVEGYRPANDEHLDLNGRPIEDQIYTTKEFDRELIIDERTRRVARWITDFLKQSGDRMQKTIVFCVDTEHAARMRQALINENKDLYQQNERYVMRITGNDPTGTNELSNFIDPESPYPVIVTTSQLLSTGVDIRTCRLIVLDREIGSMTEFKQIVGRGTRIHEDSKKYYFTLVDFRKATNHFADKDFDGDPVQIYEPGEDDSPVPPETEPTPTPDDVPADETVIVAPPPPATKHGVAEPRAKLHVRGRPVTIYGERVEYIDENGKLITESLRDYTRTTIRKQYASLDTFLRRWNAATAKGEVLKALDEEGLRLELLQEEFGAELDPFDLICHIAYDAPPLTRKQRAAAVRKQNTFAAYEPQARRVLEVLLDKYQDEGVVEIDNVAMLRIPPLNQLGSITQLIKPFGDLAAYQAAVQQMQQALYQVR